MPPRRAALLLCLGLFALPLGRNLRAGEDAPAAEYETGAYEERVLRMSSATEELLQELLRDGSLEDRVRSAWALGQARAAAAGTVEALRANAMAERPELRAAVLYALARGRAPAARALVLEGTKDPDWMPRVQALLGLGEFSPDGAASAAALRSLDAEDASVRLAALQALRAVAMPEAASPLFAYLAAETDPRRLAEALAVLPVRSLAVADGALDPFLRHADPQVRASALAAAQGCRLLSARVSVRDALADPHPLVRAASASAYAALAQGEDAAPLRARAADPDPEVRAAVAAALARFPAEGAESLATLSALRGDEFRHVRRSATVALLSLAEASAELRTAILEEAVAGCASENGARRIESLYLLGKSKDPEPLTRAMEGLTPYLASLPEQRLLVWAIGQTGAQASRDRVAEAVNAKDAVLRRHGAAGVGLLKMTDAVPMIRRTLSNTVIFDREAVYVYDGRERFELVHSLGLIATPEAFAEAVARVVGEPLNDSEEIQEEALSILVEHRVVSAEPRLRARYSAPDVGDNEKRRIVRALRLLLGREDVGLAEPPDRPVYDKFFLNAISDEGVRP